MSLAYDIMFFTPIVFTFLYFFVNFIARTPRNICIVVLGDIGRSPRMQYHALSFAKEGFRVYLVGYKGSTPQKSLLDNEMISLHHIMEPPTLIRFLPRLLSYVIKVIWQSITLGVTLMLLPKMSSIFVQNPPSIPTMAISYIVSRLRFAELVIDWHNYGYSILALTLGHTHPLVRFSKWFEKFFGRLSTENICVTHAMMEDLDKNWRIQSTVVYDRPPTIFRSVSVDEQHALFEKLSHQYPVFAASDGSDSVTAFTTKDVNGQVSKLDERPALLVSSTSWTEDEDFGILLSALQDYDESQGKVQDLPDLVCVITGKGPQKEFYRKKIESKQWKCVKFCLPWLESEDYPTLLGCADVGVCLHTSSSGLDLPMKVVDMFGCGLPVCAVNFKCIDELVQHDQNGLVFSDSQQLVSQLKNLLKGFPSENKRLSYFRQNLQLFQSQRWHQCWKQSVLPIFLHIGRWHSMTPPKPETQDNEDKKDK